MLSLAWRNVFRNRRRSVTLFLVFTISVFLITVTRFFSYGTHQASLDAAVGLETGYLQIAAFGWLENKELERALEISTEDLKRVRAVEGIRSLSPRVEARALLGYKDRSRFVEIFGANPAREKKITIFFDQVREGRLFTEEEEYVNEQGLTVRPLIIGYQLARRLNLKTGAEVSLVGGQFDGSIAAGLFRVTGIFRTNYPRTDAATVAMSLSAARELFGLQNSGDIRRYTNIALEIPDYGQVEEIQEDLVKIFPPPEAPEGQSPAESGIYDPVVHPWLELIPEVVQMMDLDQAGGEFALAFLILILSFGILNIVQMVIYERRRELGILLALGTRPPFLLKTVLLEFALILLPALLFGILLSLMAGYYLQENPIPITGDAAQMFTEYGFAPVLQTIVDPGELYIALLSILLPAILFTWLASRKILKLEPIKIIRDT